ncbi:MAG: fatty acid desaturase [Vicinamibacterales bacterium]
MARADAPSPADLIHLRPTDAHGFRVVGLALAGTAFGVLLSLTGAWPLWIAGQTLLGVMFVQWFVILHECGHETLFKTRRWHRLVGFLSATLALIPYQSWTRVHGRHHKWTGWQDLDPTTESLTPRRRRWAERALMNLCWRLWIPLFSVVYRLSNYWNLPRLFHMFPRRADRIAITRDVVTLSLMYAAAILLIGIPLALQLFAVGMLISLMIEDVLLLSQHSHVPQKVSGGASVKPFPAIDQEPFTRSLRLPRMASSFVLHFDAHELHHMYPFVPGYHLRRIDYTPENEIGWWQWVRGAKRVPADVLLYQNRAETGHHL